tara:strand:+ start:560 stop:1456 length:897 start_codon:yes stop_codon:yes gene_type:complete
MKILLTNNHLNTIGGSETFVLTLYRYLKKQGHLVHVFTFNPFYKIPLQASGKGVDQYIDDLYYHEPNTIKESYDLVLCNHNSCFEWVFNNVKFDRIHFISHGTVPALEQPRLGADKYFSMSEEIKTNCRMNGFESEVIRNPIDLDEYKPMSKRNNPLKSALCVSQGAKSKHLISSLGIPVEFAETNRFMRKIFTAEHYNKHDIVFSLGRGCYEALACDRPVIVFDTRDYNGTKYDGLVTKENFLSLASFNCSGRLHGRGWDKNIVDSDLEAVVIEEGYYRSIAEQYLDIKVITETLLK